MRRLLPVSTTLLLLILLVSSSALANTDNNAVPMPEKPAGKTGWSVSPGRTTAGLNINMGGLLGNGRTTFDLNLLGTRKDIKYSLLEGNIARTEGEKGKLRYYGTADYFAGFRGTGWAALGVSYIKGDFVPPELDVPSLAGKTYVVYDVETTGLSPRKGNEIIQIGAVKVRDGKIIDRFNSYVKPYRGIRNSGFHGVWWNDVKDSPRIEEVFPKFKEFAGSAPLVGHNERFDRRFINDANQKLYGKDMPNQAIDTLKMSRQQQPNLNNHKLNTVAGHYGITNPNAHAADADAATAAKAFVAMEKEKARQAAATSQAKPGERWRTFVGGQAGVNAFLGPEVSAGGGTDYTDDSGRTYFIGTRGSIQLGGVARSRVYAGLMDGKATIGAKGDAFAGVRATGSLSGGIRHQGFGVELTGHGHVGAGLGATGIAEIQIGWNGIKFHIDKQLYCKVGGGVGLSGSISWGEPPPALKKIVIATSRKIKNTAGDIKENVNSGLDKVKSATERFLSTRQATTQ